MKREAITKHSISSANTKGLSMFDSFALHSYNFLFECFEFAVGGSSNLIKLFI